MRQTTQSTNREAGFSIIELLVAMLVMIVITGAATTLLVGAFNVRVREDKRTESISDTRRALNILSRELANSGYQLPRGLTYTSTVGSSPVPANGLLPADCDAQSITFVANLTANLGAGDDNVNGPDEALTYRFVQDDGKGYLVRRDLNSAAGAQTLANGIDGIQFVYLNAAGADTSSNISQAVRVRITLWATLDAVGKPGSSGYQPPSQVRLASDVDLRNVTLNTF